MKVFNTVLSAVAVVLLFSVISSLGYDPCLDVSGSKLIVDFTLNYSSFSEPQNNNDVVSLIKIFYYILSHWANPYTYNIGAAWNDNTLVTVESCSGNLRTNVCAFLPRGYSSYASVSLPSNNYTISYYAINNSNADNFVLSNPFLINGTYLVTSRPWYYNSNSNGWSEVYKFPNQPLTGRTYSRTQSSTGAHIFSDKNGYEYCDQCFTVSPSRVVGQLVADSYILNEANQVTDITSEAGVERFASEMLTILLVQLQSHNNILTIGAGFQTGDFYSVTDCNALPANVRSTIIECSRGQYFAEVVVAHIFGNSNFQRFGLNSSGNITSPLRDTGVAFNTTQSIYYQTIQGVSDPYRFPFAGGLITDRTYSSRFNRGVALVILNPNSICPTYRAPDEYTSPSTCRDPSACHHNHNHHHHHPTGPSTTINFHFDGMLGGAY